MDFRTDSGDRDDAHRRIARSALLEFRLRGRRDDQGQPLRALQAKALAQRHAAERQLLNAELQRYREGQEGQTPSPAPPGTPPVPGGVNWTPVGPSAIPSGGDRVAGRVSALQIGPSGNRAYVAAANGGVWLSADGGTTWNPLDDYAVSPSGIIHMFTDALAVGAIAVSFGTTAATDELFVGTGSYGVDGIGVWHSTAGGAPGGWTLEATNLQWQEINALAIDPTTPGLVFAASGLGLFRRPTSGSTTSWSQVTSSAFPPPVSQQATDILIAGRPKPTYYVAFFNDTVYSSSDTVTWSAIPGIAANSGRIKLAAAESSPNIVYAFTGTGTLYRLERGAFQVVGGTPAANVLFPLGQGNFDLAVAVDPSNANTVYLMGEFVGDSGDLALFKGTLTGSSGSYNFGFNPANAGTPSADPTYVGKGMHADGHALGFALNATATAHDPTNVWVGCDGGVYQSTASGTNGTFKPRSTGLAITEVYYIGQRADTDAVVFAGNQDNGTVRYLGEEAWVEADGGDGGGVAVDPNNPYQVMHQWVGASLGASADGGFTFSYVNFPPITANTSAQYGAAQAESRVTYPFTSIPTTAGGAVPTLLAFGTNRLWLTSDWGNSWVTLPTATNPYTPATPNATQDVIGSITAITFASPNRIFASTSTQVWRYDQGATGWTSMALPAIGLPSYNIIFALAVEDPVAGTLYAAVGGGGIPHLYYYDGAAWHPALPTSVIDAPALAVAVDPSNPTNVYVGTIVGCWQGVRAGPATWNWALFSPGLPESEINDLKVHDRARLLRAGTYGRGVWEIPLVPPTPPAPDIYVRVNYGDTGRLTSSGSRNSWIEGLPDPTRKGFNVYHWMSADVKVRRSSLTGLPPLPPQPDYCDYAVNIGDYVDNTTNIETADAAGINKIFVEVHNRSLTPVPPSQVQVLLLITDASAGLPPLPANYASHINAGDASPSWLAGSAWLFADPITPYRTITGTLDVRTPQVVEFDVDFSTSIILPAGHDHVCAAAFVTSPADTIASTAASLDFVTMHDKHIAHRNLHLVAAGARPLPPPREGFRQDPQIVLLDFHNASEESVTTDIVFERQLFPGHISVMLPRLPELANPGQMLDGFRVVDQGGGVGAVIRSLLGEAFENVGELFERLGELIEGPGGLGEREEDEAMLSAADQRALARIRTLDRSRVFVAESLHEPAFRRIRIAGRGSFSAALVLQAPSEAKPGMRYVFHVVQRADGTVLGGSSYVFAVTQPARKPRVTWLTRQRAIASF